MGYAFQDLAEFMKFHFISLHIANVLMGVSVGVEVPILTMLGRQLGHDEKDIAKFIAFLSLCRMLPGIPIGLLSECIDVRHIMLVTVLFHVAGSALVFVLMPREISLWVFSAFNGITVGGFFLSRHLYVSLITRKKHRGMTFSFFAGALRWAHVGGPMMVGAAAALWSDGRYYLLVQITTALIALAFMLIDYIFCSSERHNESNEVGGNETLELESTELLPVAQKKTKKDTKIPHKNVVTVAASSYDSTDITYSSSENEAPNHSIGVKVTDMQDSEMFVAEKNTFTFLRDFWFVMVERWSAIWRVGVYIVLYVALRANRKLLLTFAAMRINLTDSQLAFLLSFSFFFDATLFPIGGFISDAYGRRFAMVPAVLGLGVTFMFLPLLETPLWLYVMAGAFGTADAIGCGLILTLVADYAPKKFAGPFFGVMRTVQDTGHVLASFVVSTIILRVNFVVSCSLWGAVSVVAALWALFVVRVNE